MAIATDIDLSFWPMLDAWRNLACAQVFRNLKKNQFRKYLNTNDLRTNLDRGGGFLARGVLTLVRHRVYQQWRGKVSICPRLLQR